MKFIFKSFSIAILLIAILISTNLTGCKKLIDIPPPTGSITNTQVFSTDGEATSAVSGIYFKMINQSQIYSSGGMTLFGGVSSDELLPSDQSAASAYLPFLKNQLLSSSPQVRTNFWSPAYVSIYSANSIIEGLQNNKSVHDSVRSELTGETKFVRGFCNFYLVNLFGAIPLVTTTNWHNTSLLYRSSTSEVYDAIIADLKDAQNTLAPDYSVAQGQRIIPNKWAATALLARVYLYKRDWSDAEKQATAVINNSGLYSLSNDPTQVFLTNSSEAIWQLQQNVRGSSLNVTPEGFLIIPRTLNSTFRPSFYLTNQLLNAFEPNDKRRSGWIDSTIYNHVKYYFPYKYKDGPSQAIANGNVSEYYMVLRLAEQYLIRAEARVQLGENNAVDDLNIIRRRAGLPDYAGPTDKTSLLAAIVHENQVEFFAEWGHRWLDLKRTGNAVNVLSSDKGFMVSNNALLFPIPQGELTTDPNLTQNPGY